MAVRATVLYDAPGPRGRRINSLLTILAAAVTLLAVGWIGWTLNNNGQLTAAKWTPFLDSQTWQTYILPGLWGTLRSAFVSIILAMVLGVLLGLGRLSELAWLRWICAVIVEFFRAIPVLLLMIFAYQLFAVYNMVPPRQ
ncbi:MAG: ABC transporter permease subunit, partial [Corynebacterium marinum]|nr:ABC transporter permease subunit [Corynebacterium marinum]